jgi:hypothetical protein
MTSAITVAKIGRLMKNEERLDREAGAGAC